MAATVFRFAAGFVLVQWLCFSFWFWGCVFSLHVNPEDVYLNPIMPVSYEPKDQTTPSYIINMHKRSSLMISSHL